MEYSWSRLSAPARARRHLRAPSPAELFIPHRTFQYKQFNGYSTVKSEGSRWGSVVHVLSYTEYSVVRTWSIIRYPISTYRSDRDWIYIPSPWSSALGNQKAKSEPISTTPYTHTADLWIRSPSYASYVPPDAVTGYPLHSPHGVVPRGLPRRTGSGLRYIACIYTRHWKFSCSLIILGGLSVELPVADATCC